MSRGNLALLTIQEQLNECPIKACEVPILPAREVLGQDAHLLRKFAICFNLAAVSLGSDGISHLHGQQVMHRIPHMVNKYPMRKYIP